jgi:cystathionine beta-lyase/cystathionine gamma-synthase
MYTALITLLSSLYRPSLACFLSLKNKEGNKVFGMRHASSEQGKPCTLGASSQCLHSGEWLDSVTDGAVTPIFMASSNGGFTPENPTMFYPRYLNMPNHQVLSQRLSRLEGAEQAFITSSGMAAITAAIMGMMQAGDHAIFPRAVYGGTHYFVCSQFERLGLSYTFVDGTNTEDFAQAIRPNTRLLYLETPSNPLLSLLDIKALTELAKAHKLLTLIDNTFASPINQKPLALGVDVVIHSATKYLNGHSDLIAGVILGSAAMLKRIEPVVINLGGCLNGMDYFLLERGLKTLALRMRQHNSNAQQVAEWLEAHPKVKHVYYPGLTSHPQHGLACRQMAGFGGMLSFELEGSLAHAQAAMQRLQLIKAAGSLGGVESLVCIPALTSHAKLSAWERAEAGIADSLLRLSVGVEDCDDLLQDLEQALKA